MAFFPSCLLPYQKHSKSLKTFRYRYLKMEVLNLIAGYFGGGFFPLKISLTSIQLTYRFSYLHFRYPKCLVTNFGATSFLLKISPLNPGGDISRPQVELVSWEVSALNHRGTRKNHHVFESSMLGKTRPFLNVRIRSHPTETYG